MRAILIGAFGFVGAVARYGIDSVVKERTTGDFPWGILLVNVSGCFLLGLLFTLFTERVHIDPTWRLAVTVGFLGAYTTFSTFSHHTVQLIEKGSIGLAAGNVLASVVLGLAAMYAGIYAARAF